MLNYIGISWPIQTMITFSVLIDIHTAFIFNSEISSESQSDEDMMGNFMICFYWIWILRPIKYVAVCCISFHHIVTHATSPQNSSICIVLSGLSVRFSNIEK